jgi:hypothetical protein
VAHDRGPSRHEKVLLVLHCSPHFTPHLHASLACQPQAPTPNQFSWAALPPDMLTCACVPLRCILIWSVFNATMGLSREPRIDSYAKPHVAVGFQYFELLSRVQNKFVCPISPDCFGPRRHMPLRRAMTPLLLRLGLGLKGYRAAASG